jgi:hypothetical protein
MIDASVTAPMRYVASAILVSLNGDLFKWTNMDDVPVGYAKNSLDRAQLIVANEFELALHLALRPVASD